MKEMKRIKFQVSVSSDLHDQIMQDIEENYLTKSVWFERIARMYFEKRTQKETVDKKLIKLNI
jgi:hypothetical protein